MLFSELYGSHYAAVARILTEAAKTPVTRKRMTELVRETAFAESALSIPRALERGTWPLLDKSGRSVLRHEPSTPVTTLEKRWLKSLLLDPRIALFSPDPGGLEDVEPLFSPEDFVYFDRYGDGDPFTDPGYIENFRTVLQAIAEKRRLRVRFRGGDRTRHSVLCTPLRLEYSPKDDKFRLLAVGGTGTHAINLGRVRSCQLLEAPAGAPCPAPEPVQKELTLLLRDQRNALSRALLHFSHLEKETRRLSEDVYQIRLRYDPPDETELLIRVLSFGPVLEVQGPESFRALVRERIRNQAALFRTGEARKQESGDGSQLFIRDYQSPDCREMAELFRDTVHTVNARDYTAEQLDAWAGGQVDLEAWDRSFRAHVTLVAAADGIITGFGDVDPAAGYLDRLYVHSAYQGRGIASALCDRLEAAVSGEIVTHASITARPFFEKRGYRVLREQQVERHGILLTNFVMVKKRSGKSILRT